jgi:hypothetical protein
MPGKVVIISVNGLITEQNSEGKVALETLQKLVGGYIERVPHFGSFGGQKCIAFADEDGRMKAKPINEKATELWFEAAGSKKGVSLDYIKNFLVGDVVILLGEAMKGY